MSSDSRKKVSQPVLDGVDFAPIQDRCWSYSTQRPTWSLSGISKHERQRPTQGACNGVVISPRFKTVFGLIPDEDQRGLKSGITKHEI